MLIFNKKLGPNKAIDSFRPPHSRIITEPQGLCYSPTPAPRFRGHDEVKKKEDKIELEDSTVKPKNNNLANIYPRLAILLYSTRIIFWDRQVIVGLL